MSHLSLIRLYNASPKSTKIEFIRHEQRTKASGRRWFSRKLPNAVSRDGAIGLPMLFACAAILVSGCTVRNRQQEQFNASVSQTRMACESLYSDPALDPIRGKVALNESKDQTFATLTNAAKPSQKEKAAILLWVQKRNECRQLLEKGPLATLDSMSAHSATDATTMGRVRALIGAYQQASDSLTAQLYSGQISYGDFARQRAKIGSDFKVTMAQIANESAVQSQQASIQAQQLANQRIEIWQNISKRSAGFNCMTDGEFTHCQ